MECPKCNKKNIVKANYCIECKHKFTEEDQEKAYKKTLFGRLDSIETWYDHLTLSTITDHILFKIFLLLLVLLTGLWYYHNKGINTKILESKNYEIYYNKSNDEYYLVTDDNIEAVKLNIYRPNRVKELVLVHYDKDDKEIESINYDDNEESDISLKSYNYDYYVLHSTYLDNKHDKLKIYVYPKSRINTEKESS